MEEDIIASFPSVHNRPLDNIRQEPIFRPCSKELYEVIENEKLSSQYQIFNNIEQELTENTKDIYNFF